MILQDANMKPTDRYLKNLLQESYDQKSKHQVCKLPCGHGSFELEKPQDVTVQCNTCKKVFKLLWSKINPKIRQV